MMVSPVEILRAPKSIDGPVIEGKADSAYRAYELLYFVYIAAPVIFGADKFFNALTDWSQYVAPIVERWLGEAPDILRGAGCIEMAAGLLVALNPRAGGVAVALWLWGIVATLLLLGDFYDVALCDFALSMGALALSFLAAEYDRKGALWALPPRAARGR